MLAHRSSSLCPICLTSNRELHSAGAAAVSAAGVVHLQCMIRLAEYNSNEWHTCWTCKEKFTGTLVVGLAQEFWCRVVWKPENRM